MGQRLLIVDNDRAFLKEQQVSLEAAFETEVASSPDGVIAKLEKGGYAAVLVCVEVADNKGYALCTAIRKNAALADVKVAMISAKASEEEYRRHQSLKGRADLYLHKPIAPSALVAALNPYVPMRSVDPDNPLGDLADTDLGDDWLDGLKSDIATEVEKPAPPAPASQTMAIPLAMLQEQLLAPPSRSAAQLAASDSKVYALEAQVSQLESTLAAKESEVQQLRSDFDQLRRTHDSVTQNLEDLEKRQAEAETLKKRLADTEAALRKLEESPKEESADSLKAQLRDAMGERSELLQQVESLNNQVAEKTTRIMALMKEKDRFQQQALEDQTKIEGMAALEAERDDFRRKVEDGLAQVQALESALAEAQEKAARVADLEGQLAAAEAERSGLQQSLASRTSDHESLAAEYAALQAQHQAKVDAHAETEAKLKTVANEVAALEVTIRGQGREMVDLGKRLAARDKEFETQQGKIGELEAARAELQSSLDQSRTDGAALAAQHEAERGELQNLLAAKDAESDKVKASLAEQQENQEKLQRDNQVLHGQLAERAERLSSLAALLADASDRLRKGADLAQG